MTPGFILLAAGRATRFGGNKMLARLPLTDTSVIETTLKNIPSDYPRLTICRPDQLQLITCLKTLNEPYLATAPDSSLLGDSISTAVRHTAQWGGWIICLGDMPWVTPDTYREVLVNLTHKNIVIPRITIENHHQRGNPVGFGKEYAEQLKNLAGKTGGKEITNQHRNSIHFLETKDKGILLDIDYPDDIKLNPM